MRLALIIALAALCTAGVAQQSVLGVTSTGQPATVTITGDDANVDGFRGALWGMTPDEVRAAIARDFGGAQAGPLIDDPVAGTRAMIANMQSLAPGPGSAAITYVFGAASGKLIHVNLDWADRSPTPDARTAMLTGGTQVVAGFTGSYWKIGSVVRGVVVERDLIVLFAGADAHGGAVDVRVGGVPYAMRSAGGVEPITPAAGPATLHVSFSAPTAATDTRAIKPGAF